jgi:hypothetical protein
VTDRVTYAFGDVRLDIGRLTAFRGDAAIPLEPKAFDVLRYLVERRDRLITKDELLEAVWPGTFVTPNAHARGRTAAQGARRRRPRCEVHRDGFEERLSLHRSGRRDARPIVVGRDRQRCAVAPDVRPFAGPCLWLAPQQADPASSPRGHRIVFERALRTGGVWTLATEAQQ